MVMTPVGVIRRWVTLLAVWFGPDRARLDRVFRRSALMREAWDTRPDGGSRTYGDGVIDTALADRAAVSAPTRPPPLSEHGRHSRQGFRNGHSVCGVVSMA